MIDVATGNYLSAFNIKIPFKVSKQSPSEVLEHFSKISHDKFECLSTFKVIVKVANTNDIIQSLNHMSEQGHFKDVAFTNEIALIVCGTFSTISLSVLYEVSEELKEAMTRLRILKQPKHTGELITQNFLDFIEENVADKSLMIGLEWTLDFISSGAKYIVDRRLDIGVETMCEFYGMLYNYTTMTKGSTYFTSQWYRILFLGVDNILKLSHSSLFRLKIRDFDTLSDGYKEVSEYLSNEDLSYIKQITNIV